MKDDKNKKKNRDLVDYTPEALGALTAGLMAYHTVNSGGVKGLQPMYRGAKDGVLKALNKTKGGRAYRLVEGLAKGGYKSALKINKGYDAFEVAYRKANNIPLGSVMTPAERRKVFDLFKSEQRKAMAFAKDNYKSWADANKVDTPIEDLKGALKKEYESHLWELKKSSPPGANDFSVDFNRYIGKQDDGVKINEGVQQGIGFAAANLAAHALGQKYLDSKEDDKVRDIIRKSYDGAGGSKNRYQDGPQKRVDRMGGQRPYNGPRRDGHSYYRGPHKKNNRPYQNQRTFGQENGTGLATSSVEKQASAQKLKKLLERADAAYGKAPLRAGVREGAEEVVQRSTEEKTASEILSNIRKLMENQKFKNNVEPVINGAIDGSIAMSPVALSVLLNRDLKNGLRPLNKDKNGDEIVIDVPMLQATSMIKSAGAEDVVAAVDDPIKKWLVERKKRMLGVLPWTVIPGVLYGKSMDTYANGSKDTASIPEGFARVSIKTPARDTDTSTMMMKSASSKPFKDLVKNLEEDLDPDEEEQIRRGLEKMLGQEAAHKLFGRSNQFRFFD